MDLDLFMVPPLFKFNIWVLLACGVVGVILGMFWYAQGVFGNRPSVANTLNMGKTYVVAFINSFFMASLLSSILVWVGLPRHVSNMLELTLALFLGLIAPAWLCSTLWEGRSVKTFLINAGYQLTLMCIISLILFYWR